MSGCPAEPAPLDEAVALSTGWLSAVLDADVRDVEVVERLETVATKVRFRASLADGSGRALCVKAYFNPAMRARVNAGVAEVRFYLNVAEAVSGTHGVEVPRHVYGGIDESTGHALVLMEDLVARGATFLTALSPYTADQAAATLDQLARLHAVWWDDRLRLSLGFLEPRLASFLAYVDTERLQQQLDGRRGAALPSDVKDAARLRAALLAIAARDGDGPQCLVHGDAHAGNLYETAAGSPGLIDWQVVQRGSWALDVAYHLGAVLDVGLREDRERDLLAHYCDALARHGGPSLVGDVAWLEYRAHLAYGYFMWGITQQVEPAIVETFTTRLGTAVAHHDSFSLLGV